LIIGLLVAAAVLVVVFVRVELRSPDPMMDVRVFGDRVYTTAIITLFIVLFCVYGLLLVLTQYFQNVRDYSPERAGVVLLAYTGPMIVLSPVAGAMAAKDGGRRPTLAGVTSLILGLLVIIVGIGRPLVLVIVGLLLVSVATGLSLSPTTNVAMSSIPPERAGMASGIMSAQRALGSTAGFAIMGSVLAAVVGSVLPAKFEPYLAEPARTAAVEAVVDDANPRAVVSLIGPGKPLPDAVADRQELIDAADDAFADGIRIALSVGLVLAILALIAGAKVFPKGVAEEHTEEAESDTLTSSETVPDVPG
jgi:MFS family permease